ncbi:MAG: hypothetical protein J6Y11_14565 [Paludibacteraceae bacterium]|nr:hypothetical protein [Paludibacteraceae bacterium]
MAVKLLFFHIRQNTGYDFFALETYPFISDNRKFQADGAKSSIINRQPSIINRFIQKNITSGCHQANNF